MTLPGMLSGALDTTKEGGVHALVHGGMDTACALVLRDVDTARPGMDTACAELVVFSPEDPEVICCLFGAVPPCFLNGFTSPLMVFAQAVSPIQWPVSPQALHTSLARLGSGPELLR